MQQPPRGPQRTPPYRPAGGPHAGGPYGAPQGGTPPPGSSHAPGRPAGSPFAPAGQGTAPVPLALARRKKRGALRFVAGSCIFSAWLTLVLAVLLAGGSFMTGFAMAGSTAAAAGGTSYFPPPQPDGGVGLPPGMSPGDLGLPGGGGTGPGLPELMDLGRGILPTLFFGSGIATLLTGVVGFLLFLGLGQACYLLLELEEQSLQMAQTLDYLMARLSAGR